jgi:translation initiation factor 2 alpha subunit (eIF-2alpha)
MEEYNEGDVLLGTVRNIEGTTVFVDLPNGQTGTIITSEIAPGRIRNLREYVVPKKKIVCKILRVSGDQLDLSLRRVGTKEKSEILAQYKQEQTSKSAIYSILKDKAEEIEKKILKEFKSLFEFLTHAREDEKLIEKHIPASFREQIKKITQKKRKDIEIKETIKLKCLDSDGVKKIKEIFSFKEDNIKVTYISAGKFQINIKDSNYKDANKKMQSTIEKIEEESKKHNCEFEYNKK